LPLLKFQLSYVVYKTKAKDIICSHTNTVGIQYLDRKCNGV